MEFDVVLGVWVFDHSVSVEEFVAYIGASNTDEGYDAAQVTRSLDASYSLVNDFCRSALPTRPVPQPVYEQAVLEVAHETYKRKNSTTGQDQFVQYNGGGAPTRGPRDPLTQVYPMLRKYVGLGFA